MDYNELVLKKEKFDKIKGKLSTITVESYNKTFDIRYTHDSTAIEGNTLSLIETKVIIEEGMSISNKPLREIYEVVNHNKAFEYLKHCIKENKPLSETIVKDIHALVMANILIGGVYRMVDVYITGSTHTPPTPNEMYHQVKNFYKDLIIKEQNLNPIQLACWTHAEFVKIHPFADGNGRTSRLIMNYQLMRNGFLPISITKEDRFLYFESLEKYVANKDLSCFIDLVIKYENIELDKYLNMSLEI